MQELRGNLAGIKDSVQKDLSLLFDFPVGTDEFLPYGLAQALCRFSAQIRREISLYLSRGGEVLDIAIGQRDSVPLMDLSQRRNGNRLSRVRCVHTHPDGQSRLSDVDLSALKSLRLDAICALGANEDGSVAGASVCYLLPDETGFVPGPVMVTGTRALSHPKWMEAVELNDRAPSPEQFTQAEIERAYLIGIDTQSSLDELASLAGSAGAKVVGRALQAKSGMDPRSYIGSGKALEVALDVQAQEANLVIADDELTSVQLGHLEELTGARVIDRTTLILDIFAQRATTSEGKLQVSLAQLKYRSGHLIGARSALSRLAGGIGTRGPGESKLEMDRRYIRRRIQILGKDLEELERQRAIRRKNRQQSDIPVVALVGYTNTGKSSLLNRLSGAQVNVEDQLFVTLDAVSRKVDLPDGDSFLLVDSVGFISKLPTDLVEAFKSTLEETALADILVIVSDAANPKAREQHQVVESVLHDLGAVHQPRIEVLNKADIAQGDNGIAVPGALWVSARTGEGVDQLLGAIAQILRDSEREYTVFVSFTQYEALNELRRQGRILIEEHKDTGTRVVVRLKPVAMMKLSAQYPGMFTPEKTDGC
ncbi:MAG: GTPase HflX [Eubacteriales bacterium]|jgi:GTP-binding protein HflX|nr:GTPase HflX [Eubacteriales bacterium]